MMKKINIPVSKMGSKFAGKWVAIDTKKQRIIAYDDTLKGISKFVSGKVGEEHKIKAAAFLVPRKGEGPYILFV